MDPYLERPDLWPNVHNSLIIALRDDLAPRLRPRYYVAVEERTVQAGTEELLFALRPDVAVMQTAPTAPTSTIPQRVQHDPIAVTVELPMPDELTETYLEIREVGTSQVVTVIEVLSPANKMAGEGRRQFERKRLALFGTQTHLVEIDLLRMGTPLPVRGTLPLSDYRLLVSHAARRPRAEILAFSMRQPIPTFSLPLLADEAERVDLNHILHQLYDRAGYDLRIDYHAPPPPPTLSPADAEWVAAVIQAFQRET
jgi:hypothetical protein